MKNFILIMLCFASPKVVFCAPNPEKCQLGAASSRAWTEMGEIFKKQLPHKKISQIWGINNPEAAKNFLEKAKELQLQDTEAGLYFLPVRPDAFEDWIVNLDPTHHEQHIKMGDEIFPFLVASTDVSYIDLILPTYGQNNANKQYMIMAQVIAKGTAMFEKNMSEQFFKDTIFNKELSENSIFQTSVSLEAKKAPAFLIGNSKLIRPLLLIEYGNKTPLDHLFDAIEHREENNPDLYCDEILEEDK